MCFHVPAVLTFSGFIAGQHGHTLLFFVFSVVQGRWIAANVLYVDTMQGRMVARVVHASLQVQTNLFPLGQTQSRTQLSFHALS
jgi:hypothetical protein